MNVRPYLDPQVRVAVFRDPTSPEIRLSRSPIVAGPHQIDITTFDEFGAALLEDPALIGLLCAAAASPVASQVREMREAGIMNKLMVLLTGVRADTRKFVEAAVRVLGAGADDCQAADIDPREVSARIAALALRGEYLDHLHIRFCDCEFSFHASEIRGPGITVRLAPQLSKVFLAIARGNGNVVSKRQIFDAVYGFADGPDMKGLDVQVCYLRRKIAAATGGIDVIRTNWGRGYVFEPDGVGSIPAAAFAPKRGPERRTHFRIIETADRIRAAAPDDGIITLRTSEICEMYGLKQSSVRILSLLEKRGDIQILKRVPLWPKGSQWTVRVLEARP